nr:autotransporter-associated beta strand repeat-containing protein [Martelella sp. AD-3]
MSANFRSSTEGPFSNGHVAAGATKDGRHKPRPLSRFLSGTAFTTLLLASGAALYCGMPQQASALDLYWNAPGTSVAVIGDGSPIVALDGTWSVGGNLNWTNAGNTQAGVTWSNAPGTNAYFIGTAADHPVIDVVGDINFDTIYLGAPNGNGGNSNFYVIQGTGAFHMAPATGNHATIVGMVQNSQSIAVPIHNSQDGSVTDLYIESNDGTQGGGLITFVTNMEYTGNTHIKSGALSLGGLDASGYTAPYYDASVNGDIIVSDAGALVLYSATQDQTVSNRIYTETTSDTNARLDIRNGNSTHKLILTSSNPDYVGNTNISGILSGTGSLGGAVELIYNGSLYNRQGSTLTLGTSVKFTRNPTGGITADLEEATAGQPLFVTSGALDVSLATLTATVQGSASVYNIFQYGGALNQVPGTIFKTTTITGLPAGKDYELNAVDPNAVVSSPGMIRLITYDRVTGETPQYWNGGAPGPGYTSTPLTGGSGTWIAGLGNWTQPDGSNSAAWVGSVGYFQGNTAGTVTVVGSLGFDRLVFSAQEYHLIAGAGGVLQMSPRLHTVGEIDVDTVTATIAVDITDGMNRAPVPAAVNSLTKGGTGTLVFVGNKTYTGGTTVSGGTLQLGDGTTNSTILAGITIAPGATLAVNQAASQPALSFSNVLTATLNNANPAIFHVMGAGQLDFSSNSNTFLGQTNVTAGTFNMLANSVLGGTVALTGGTLNGGGTINGNVSVTGGTLKGTGTINGDVTVSQAGTIAGDYSTTPVLTINGALTLGNGSTLNVTLDPAPGANPSPALITVTTLNMTSGNVVFLPANLVVGQRYNLIQFTASATGSASNLTLMNNPNRYRLGNDPTGAPGFLYIIASPPGGQQLFWHPLTPPGPNNFGGSGTWDAATTMSWADSSGQPPLLWSEADIAVFTQTGGTVTVDSTAPISINGMQFTVTGYELRGTDATSTLTLDATPGAVSISVSGTATDNAKVGVILGDGGNAVPLSKTGTGTLILTAANTYSGGTTVSEGTLQLGDGTTNGSVTGNITISAGATLSVYANAASTLAAPLDFGNVLQPSDATSQFVVNGPGVVNFTSASAGFLGQTTVVAGATLTGSATGNLGGTVTIAGEGTLAGSGGTTFTLGAGAGGLVLTNAAGMTGPSTIEASGLTAGAASLFSTGTLTAAGVVLVNAPVLAPSQQPYFLIDYTAINGVASDIKIASASAGIDVNATNATVVSVGSRIAILVGTGTNVDTSAGVWWNGTTTQPPTTQVIGGPGTWTADQAAATAMNWTDSGGTAHVAWKQAKTAIFAGTPQTGAVSVDSTTSGTITVQGLDFRVGGYTLSGVTATDAITLQSAWDDNLARLNADAQAVTATIAVNLDGPAGVRKNRGRNHRVHRRQDLSGRHQHRRRHAPDRRGDRTRLGCRRHYGGRSKRRHAFPVRTGRRPDLHQCLARRSRIGASHRRHGHGELQLGLGDFVPRNDNSA